MMDAAKQQQDNRKAEQEAELAFKEIKKHLKSLSKNQLIATVIDLMGRIMKIQENQEALAAALQPQVKEENESNSSDSSPATV